MADLMQQARAQFEAWATARGKPIHRRDVPSSERHGQYGNVYTQQCWEAWEAAALRAAPEWRPMETAPLDMNVLMLWRPVDADKRPWHVEVVIAQLSSYEVGSIWLAGRYQPASHVSHWMPLPVPPLAARPQGVPDAG